MSRFNHVPSGDTLPRDAISSFICDKLKIKKVSNFLFSLEIGYHCRISQFLVHDAQSSGHIMFRPPNVIYETSNLFETCKH